MIFIQNFIILLSVLLVVMLFSACRKLDKEGPDTAIVSIKVSHSQTSSRITGINRSYTSDNDTELIALVTDNTTFDKQYLSLENRYQFALTDLSTNTVSLTVPLDTGIKLYSYGYFDDIFTVSELENTATQAEQFGETSSFTISIGDTSKDVYLTIIDTTDYALYFDGTNDYVSLPNNPFSNNNTFTIQAWLKPDVVGDGAYHGFLGMQTSGRKPSLWVDNNGDLHYDSYKGSQRFSGTISDGSNKFFTVSEWVHIAWTNDGINYKFYRNGVLVDTKTAPDTFNALDNIGYQIGKVDNYFKGQIDEVAIWDVALGNTNITALYNSGIGLKASTNSGNYVKSGDLVGYWQFNNGTAYILTDNTSNSNNGTLNDMDSSSWVTSGLNLKN
jgi:hypothetical protein